MGRGKADLQQLQHLSLSLPSPGAPFLASVLMLIRRHTSSHLSKQLFGSFILQGMGAFHQSLLELNVLTL